MWWLFTWLQNELIGRSQRSNKAIPSVPNKFSEGVSFEILQIFLSTCQLYLKCLLFWGGFATSTLMSYSSTLVAFFVSKEATTLLKGLPPQPWQVLSIEGVGKVVIFYCFTMSRKTFIFFFGWSDTMYLWNVSLLNQVVSSFKFTIRWYSSAIFWELIFNPFLA